MPDSAKIAKAVSIGRGMHLISLNNFAGQKAAAMRRKRHTDYEIEALKHQIRLIDLDAEYGQAMRAARYALQDFRFLEAWRKWKESRVVLATLKTIRRLPPVLRVASIEEQQARAGDEAERMLDEFLGFALGDQWTLIAGYSGRGGEIDRILIGPWGVYAFEIKGNRGMIHSDGSRWWVERYGCRGDLVSAKELHRDPDAQLARAVRPLQSWLGRNDVNHVPIRKVVLFTAEDAILGRIQHKEVDVVTTLRGLDLGNLFNPGSEDSRLSPQLCERIVSLIQRDHAFWERKREEHLNSDDHTAISRPSFAGL
jgi:hypothetical protein